MEVYNNLLKFQRNCVYISGGMAYLNHDFPILWRTRLSCTIQINVLHILENHDFKDAISYDLHVQSVLNYKGLLQTSIPFVGSHWRICGLEV